MSRYLKGSKELICRLCGADRDLTCSSILCKDCRLIKNREAWNRWQNSMSPEEKTEYLARVAKNQLKAALKKYNLTLMDYDSLLIKQGYSCGICLEKDPGGKGRWHIDHDHLTNKVRGLLCHNCNTALGGFKDSVGNLQRAINYLAKSF